MNHTARIALAVMTVCWVAADTARSEGVEEVVARASKLTEVGEPSEATAVLARAFAQQRDPVFLRQWLEINDKWISGLESRVSRKELMSVPEFDPKPAAAAVSSDWKNWVLWAFSHGPTTGPPVNPLALPVAVGTVQQYSEALKEQRQQLSKQKPLVIDDDQVRARLSEIDACFRSIDGSLAAISGALQAADVADIDSLVELKHQAQAQMKQLKDTRALFVSYDHLAPRLIDARISLIPDAFGVKGHYVTEDSLRHAAEMLGGIGRDWEFAHRDVKRLWLDTYSQLKQCSGTEQLKDLESLATLVGNPNVDPSQWEPK